MNNFLTLGTRIFLMVDPVINIGGEILNCRYEYSKHEDKETSLGMSPRMLGTWLTCHIEDGRQFTFNTYDLDEMGNLATCQYPFKIKDQSGKEEHLFATLLIPMEMEEEND